MNYQEAVEYTDGLQMFTKKHAPAHTKEFLRYLGNPERKLKVIHMAGTNGKGSVCAYMQAILKSEGKTTGLFISPHLVTIRERIRINGEMLSEEAFLRIFKEVQKAVQKMEKDGLSHPTYFEFLFGMAVRAFAEAGVEYAILETGLGGRLDATNSVEKPVLTVITSIGLDHTEILGDTIEKIAAEKAGIIKAGVPLVMDASNETAANVLRKAAENAGVLCREIGENAYEIQEITGKYIAFSSINLYDDTACWKIPTTAVCQPANALLALEGMTLVLKEHHASWREALMRTVWEGRMEEIRPGVILDGAHNLPAVKMLAESIREQIRVNGKRGRIIVLFSAVKEKNYDGMIECICREIPADLFIVTELESLRAAGKEKLKQDFEKYTGMPVLMKDTSREAWQAAMREKGEQDMLYCFGSLYLAGEIKALLREE